jgi:hypothetical protein
MKPEIILLMNGEEISEVSFGIVPAGVKKELFIEVKNVGEVEIINLDFIPESQEVIVESKPEKLSIGESASLLLSYTPSIIAEEGLKSVINISGTYIV